MSRRRATRERRSTVNDELRNSRLVERQNVSHQHHEEVAEMKNIKLRRGADGMVRVVVGDTQFDVRPSLLQERHRDSLLAIIADEREFKERGV
jgi:hypothetical protein